MSIFVHGQSVLYCLFGDINIVIIIGLSKPLAFFHYAILALAKLKLYIYRFVAFVESLAIRPLNNSTYFSFNSALRNEF